MEQHKLKESVEVSAGTTSKNPPPDSNWVISMKEDHPVSIKHAHEDGDSNQWVKLSINKLKESVEANIPNEGTRSKKPQPDSNCVISIKEDHPFSKKHPISIEERLKEACEEEDHDQWANLSIYKIPKRLRGTDDHSYIPQIVSIGPYHRWKRFTEMEQHKLRALSNILKRNKQDVNLYLNSIRKVENKARDRYEGKAKNLCTTDEFIEMMVLDGCFILELFKGTDEGFKEIGYSSSDPIFSKRGINYFLQRDLIMLENQLPLFILDLLLGLQKDKRGSVAKLALKFFDSLMIATENSTSVENENENENENEALHLTDVYRRSLLRTTPQIQSSQKNSIKEGKQHLIYSVTELREAGINFKKRKTNRFWDIKFKCGKLRIPHLFIHHSTKSVLLNLIAFEQCHSGCTNHIITAYVIFMDNLINSPKDIKYLHYCGIIEHCLGSDEEVAELFNSLCKEVVFDFNDSYLADISNQITHHCNRWYNTCAATLRHNYCQNPWACISVIAATALLLLTIAQTFYTVYGYYKPIS